MKGSVTYGERVVIVEVERGCVHLKTGHISSTDSSHVDADNRNTTVVWGDQQFQPVMESPDEAHERSYKVDDIHLLKAQEAYSLGDPVTAKDWFGTIYQDRLVTKINRALKRLIGRQHQQTCITLRS
jgi:hypothetical protein